MIKEIDIDGGFLSACSDADGGVCLEYSDYEYHARIGIYERVHIVILRDFLNEVIERGDTDDKGSR